MNEAALDKTADFTKVYLVVNEVLNAVTHGIGVGLSIAGLVILLLKGVRSGSAIATVTYAIYGSTLILLYLSSTLYHSLTFTRAQKLFKIFDHSCIFLLIAGTYTPYTLVAMGGTLGWVLFGIIWAIAALGIVYKIFWINKYRKYSTLLYVAMGWLIVFAMKPLYQAVGIQGLGLLLAGGLAFTVGALFYRLKRVKFMHVVWHLFVLAGTVLMYFSILYYV